MGRPASAVLVAEDEPQLLRLVERVFERAGYQVVGARDGEEALTQLATQGDRIGVAVLDAAIRPRGCRELLEAIGKEAEPIGVVLTSGDALEEDLERLMLEHEGVFLLKPYAPRQLLRAVERALGGERA